MHVWSLCILSLNSQYTWKTFCAFSASSSIIIGNKSNKSSDRLLCVNPQRSRESEELPRKQPWWCGCFRHNVLCINECKNCLLERAACDRFASRITPRSRLEAPADIQLLQRRSVASVTRDWDDIYDAVVINKLGGKAPHGLAGPGRSMNHGSTVRMSSVGVVVERAQVLQRRSVTQGVIFLHTTRSQIITAHKYYNKLL